VLRLSDGWRDKIEQMAVKISHIKRSLYSFPSFMNHAVLNGAVEHNEASLARPVYSMYVLPCYLHGLTQYYLD